MACLCVSIASQSVLQGFWFYPLLRCGLFTPLSITNALCVAAGNAFGVEGNWLMLRMNRHPNEKGGQHGEDISLKKSDEKLEQTDKKGKKY